MGITGQVELVVDVGDGALNENHVYGKCNKGSRTALLGWGDKNSFNKGGNQYKGRPKLNTSWIGFI